LGGRYNINITPCHALNKSLVQIHNNKGTHEEVESSLTECEFDWREARNEAQILLP
jgi:hypothetical protein